ncbi:hypothetical protein MFUL124B02_08360 [Myxococcus fulvus 124B02]|nr:hypothetical protein MFUL124B02_08360 [Myxococcus fulvus 124B02]
MAMGPGLGPDSWSDVEHVLSLQFLLTWTSVRWP